MSIWIISLEKVWRKGSLGVSRDCPNFSGTPYYLRNGKSYGFQIWPVHSDGPSKQKPIKILEKKERGHIQGLPNFYGYPYYLRKGKSYGFQIWPVHSEGPSEQKPIKNFGKSSHGRSQGLSKIFRAPIHRAHRAVIFAIAQLSCFCLTVYSVGLAAVLTLLSGVVRWYFVSCIGYDVLPKFYPVQSAPALLEEMCTLWQCVINLLQIQARCYDNFAVIFTPLGFTPHTLMGTLPKTQTVTYTPLVRSRFLWVLIMHLHCKLQCKCCNAISTQKARECTKTRISRPQN